MSHLASTRAAATPEIAANRVRPPVAKDGFDHHADADFGQHLAGMVAGDERAGSPEVREPPAVRRRQLADAKASRLHGQDLRGELDAIAAGLAIAGKEANGVAGSPQTAATLLGGNLEAAAALVTALPEQPTVYGEQSLSRIGKGLDLARLPATAEDADLPRAPEGTSIDPIRPEDGNVRVGARRHVQDVFILGRETHFAPVALPAVARQAVRLDMAQTTASVGSVAAEGARALDASAELAVRPASKLAARGDGAGHPRAHGAPSGPIAAEPGSQVQARIADDASFDATHVGQVVQSLPQALASPVQQIADRITADLAATGEKGGLEPASSVKSGSGTHPLKVLTIQLHPAELGTVTVRMAMKDGALDLQVEVSRRDTAHLLDADRDRLSGMLRSAGYHVEAVTVRAVEPPGAAASAGSPQNAPNGALQSQQDGSQADARPWGGQEHREQDGDTHGTRPDTSGEPDGSRHRDGRDLYV